jgi:hypothetical protein
MKKIMKTLKLELSYDIFNDFALTNEEMINVRGGDGEPIVKPQLPPIII